MGTQASLTGRFASPRVQWRSGSILVMALITVGILLVVAAVVTVVLTVGAWMMSPPAASGGTSQAGLSSRPPEAVSGKQTAEGTMHVVAMSATGGGTAAGVSLVAVQDDQSDPTVSEVTVPLAEGYLNVGALLGALADEVGLNGTAVSQAVTWRIKVNDTDTEWRLMLIQQLTRGVAEFHVTDDALVMRIDRLKIRRERAQMQEGLRRLLARWFPDLADAAMAQFGITVHLPDGSEMRWEHYVDSITEPMPAHVVALIHGLDEPGKLWRSLIPPLLEDDYFVCEIDYPNDQAILESADDVADDFAALKAAGVQRISLVTHSMGGLVCREILTSASYYKGRGSGQALYPDIDRLVMIGTPNHGSKLAKLRLATELREQFERALSGEGLLLGALYDGAGEAADDLKPGSEFLTALNARPLPEGVRMTIIAGIASPITSDAVTELEARIKAIVPGALQDAVDETGQAFKELSDGLGDGCVTLESARLDGVDDLVQVDGNHLSMIRNWTLRSSRVPPAVPLVMDRLNSDRRQHQSAEPDLGPGG